MLFYFSESLDAKLPPHLAPQWATLEGVDAQDFLHRITTAHTKSLEVGQGLDACLLTAQGKIRSFFSVWRLQDKQFGLKWPQGLALLEPLDSVTFGESFQVKNWSASPEGMAWVSLFPSGPDLIAPIPFLPAEGTCARHGDLQILRHFDRTYGRPWIAVGGPSKAILELLSVLANAQGTEALHSDQIEAWRIEQITPSFPQEINTGTNPLEVALGYAIAENKGCYPGQEVIERIRSMGSPPRNLVLMKFPKIIHPAPPLPTPTHDRPLKILAKDGGNEIGQLTSIRYTDHETFALGLVRKGQSQVGLRVVMPGVPEMPGIEGEIIGVGEKVAPRI